MDDIISRIPAGWKLVPVEPTSVMTAAYSVAAEELTKRHLLSGSYPATWQPIAAGYAAMLVAAPTPPVTTLRLPEPMTDDDVHKVSGAQRDALLDHIYEYGTEAEGIMERVEVLARAIEAEVLRRVKECNE